MSTTIKQKMLFLTKYFSVKLLFRKCCKTYNLTFTTFIFDFPNENRHLCHCCPACPLGFWRPSPPPNVNYTRASRSQFQRHDVEISSLSGKRYTCMVDSTNEEVFRKYQTCSPIPHKTVSVKNNLYIFYCFYKIKIFKHLPL